MKMCCQYIGKSRAAAQWTHAVNCREREKEARGQSQHKLSEAIQNLREHKKDRNTLLFKN